MRMLGTAKVCITPPKPVRLCGYGFRKTAYESVQKDIFIRVFDLREGNERVLIIYGDLLWWNSTFVSQMRNILLEQFSLSESQVLFTASHNHSGPGTGDSFIPLLETVDCKYKEFLIQQVVMGVELAEKNREKVVLKRSEGVCSLNVYRRIVTNTGVVMRPNYEVKPDNTLTLFSFYRSDGSLKGRICHYPCHANLSKSNKLHPDYPGYALEMAEREWPNSVSIFFQGFTADIRPNCVLGDMFRAGSFEDVHEYAACFHTCVKSATLHEDIVEEGLSLIHRRIPLSVAQVLTVDEIMCLRGDSREEMRQWAEMVLKKGLPDSEILELSVLSMGEQRCFFMNAEVSMYYASVARKVYPGAVCTGYTNGMIGYLSTARQIQEGGYEPKDSAVYFAVAGTYDASIQTVLEEAITQWQKG